MYIVFDTETTGKPKTWKAPITQLDNWPRIIQLAWVMYDIDQNVVAKSCDLVKPDGWTIPNEKFWIDNGYNTERSERYGIPIQNVLENFLSAINRSLYIVSHNMSFDYNVAGAEMIRAKLSASSEKVKICTKVEGTQFCQLPGGYNGEPKWPTLTELHTKLFNKGFEGAHDALADVEACSRCFFALLEKGIIDLTKPKKFQ